MKYAIRQAQGDYELRITKYEWKNKNKHNFKSSNIQLLFLTKITSSI